MLWHPTNLDQKADLLRWVEARLDHRFDRMTALPVAVMRGNEVAAVVIYHQKRGPGVEMTIAAATPRWATRQVISDLLRWPFEQLKVNRITAIVASRNDRSQLFVERLGFIREGCMRDAFEYDDALVYGFTVEDWQASRWHVAPSIMRAA